MQQWAAAWQYSREELLHSSPTVLDGCTPEQEVAMRRDATEYIARVFETLHREEKHVRRETQAYALLLFHRFYARCSMLAHDRVLTATVAMMLACKIDSRPRFLADFALVYAERVDGNRALDPRSERGVAVREAILAAERTLLQVLEFDFFTLLLPYEHIGTYIAAVGVHGAVGDDVEKLAAQAATSALKTSLVLQYDARTLAAAAVLVALRIKRVALSPDAAARLPVDGRMLADILAQMSEASARPVAGGAAPAPAGPAAGAGGASGMPVVSAAGSTHSGSGVGSPAPPPPGTVVPLQPSSLAAALQPPPATPR